TRDKEDLQDYTQYLARIGQLAFETLELQPDVGEVTETDGVGNVLVAFKSAKQPDLALETILEIRQVASDDPATAGWHVWNGEVVHRLLLRAVESTPELADRLAVLRDNYEARMDEIGVVGPFGSPPAETPERAAALDRNQPTAVAAGWLALLSKGNVAEADKLRHPDSDRARELAALRARAGDDADALEPVLDAAGEVYNAIFEGLDLAWRIPGTTSTVEEETTLAVRLISENVPEIVVDGAVVLRRYAPEGGQAGWYVWDAKVLDALDAAIKKHAPALADKLQALREAVSTAEAALDDEPVS
ncbi:MAG TPA: hypothetical protein PKL84_10575, partial [Candidatus Hydrogenedentes bacterium]|nr:hypothetical protein [Candidatus Hydrogenedentota bacterium]